MDYKYSNKYFKATKLISLIGIATLFVGIILFIVVAIMNDIFPAIFTAGWFIIGGIVLIIFGNAGNMTDIEYDEQAEKFTPRFLERAMTKFNVEDKHIKIIEPIILQGYHFKNEEDYMFKKGNDNKYRSNNFYKSVLMFGPQQMYVYVYRLSMTDEKNPDSELMEKYKYLDLDSASLEDKKVVVKIKDKDANIDFTLFEIKNNDGEVIISIPSSNDAIMDGKVLEINKYIAKVKKQAEANT